MALSAATLAADLTAIHADLPETASFGALSGLACNRVSMQSREIESRGREFADTYRFSLSFRAAVFTAGLPAAGDVLTYEATVWRVLDTDESPDGAEIRVHLASRYAK